MRALVVSLCLLFAGCVSAPACVDCTQRARLDQEFTLALGDSTLIEGASHVVRFLEVIEDSRCAEGVVCVWEGNARLRISVDGSILELNTSPRFPPATDASGIRLEIRRLEPAPRADTPAQGYVVTLLATKS